ncbi:hypothetical protein D068_cds21250 [Bacillus atrophaeus UCMB-5137]|nr:hypothetical protein D068_cds21250 [Bacillus atrophaeus UCMB-5137]
MNIHAAICYFLSNQGNAFNERNGFPPLLTVSHTILQQIAKSSLKQFL